MTVFEFFTTPTCARAVYFFTRFEKVLGYLIFPVYLCHVIDMATRWDSKGKPRFTLEIGNC